MNQNYHEKIISAIDDRYIAESIKYAKRSKKKSAKVLKRAGNIAACLGIVFVLSLSLLSAATAAGVLPAYDVLSYFFPDIAEHLTPVNVSCTDNGVEMKVEAVYVHGKAAEIYISLKDLEGDRIDGTVDLVNNYSIHIPGGYMSACSLVDFDEESGTATFLISIRREEKEITGQRMTFSVSGFLSGKQEITMELPEIDLQNVPEVTEVQRESERDMSGYSSQTTESGMRLEDVKGYLFPSDESIVSPADGAMVTAYGFIDGKLHIQAYYKDIHTYDNHGAIYLVDDNGEPENADTTKFPVTAAFWDEEKKGSYQEYVFDVGPKDDLSSYSAQGYFVTCSDLIEGNWQVSFPIENMQGDEDSDTVRSIGRPVEPGTYIGE